MEWLQDRKIILAIGGGVLVLMLSLLIALVLVRHGQQPKDAPPASVGGLVVQMGPPQDAKLDPKQPLRCFVNGQFAGMETLADCAKNNGVATKALDVGIDPNGAPAAGQAGVNLAPLPPAATVPADPAATGGEPAQTSTAPGARGPVGDCLRYGGAGWRKIGDGLTLSACVQALFAGHCEKPGGASYGRWGTQTLRLVPHRVEGSADNMNFHPIAEQTDAGCAIADF
jgi:hypothetical protein